MSKLTVWFKSIFTKDNVKAILDLGLSILKMILGSVAHDLAEIAKQEVINAEASGKTGKEKYEIAFIAIKKRLPEVRDSAINLAIEIAVNALLSAKK